MTIEYGLKDGTKQTQQWTGNLKFMEEEEVTLDEIINNGSQNTFEVTVSNPNGTTDMYSDNDFMSSDFEDVPIYNSQFLVRLKTNNYGGQNSWKIENSQGEIVYSNGNFANNTLYVDTILLGNGCFTFTLEDTGGDGLDFWYWDNVGQPDGTGYINFMYYDTISIFKTFHKDFGSRIVHSFRIIDQNSSNDSNSFNCSPTGCLELYDNSGDYESLNDCEAFCDFENSSNCTELFFSEYVEGSSNNKALEIYNPTSSSIDLSNYSIERYSNGSLTVSDVMTLSGILLPGQTWVVTNSDTNSTNEFGYIQMELYEMADQLAPSYPSPLYFNGNDAITLSKNGTIIDIIGKIGENPGDAWTDDASAGFTETNGGAWWTKNHTMKRKFNITQGVTSNPILFDPSTEWDTLSIDDWSNLGFHQSQCNQTIEVITCSRELSLEDSTFGLWPDTIENLTTAFVNEFYEDNILIKAPATIGEILGDPYTIDLFGFSYNIAALQIDSFKIIEITGLPNFISYDLSNNGIIGSNSTGCINFSGLASEDDIGNYPFIIHYDFWFTISISPFSFSSLNDSYNSFEGYIINVNEEQNNCDTITNNFITNPATSIDDCNGIAIIETSGGQEPYLYYWNGIQSSNISYLCPGFNILTTYDSNDCFQSDTIFIGPENFGCMDSLACNYDLTANIQDNSCIYPFANLDCDFNCLNDFDLDGICDEDEVFGCTDSNSPNFNVLATEDDGSCIICNLELEYISSNSTNTQSCDGIIGVIVNNTIYDYTIYINSIPLVSNYAINSCYGENIIFVEDQQGCTVSDIFLLNSNEIVGCTDQLATNFNELANADDGSCQYVENPCDITPTGLFVDDIIHDRVVFNWSAPSAAPSHYMIRYRPVGTSSWTVMTAGPVNTNEFTGTSRTRYFMEPGTTYQWNIRARVLNEDGSTNCQSPWSASSQYTTLEACANLENLSASTEANWVTLSADAPDASWGVWQSKGKVRVVGTNSFRYLNGNANGDINVLKGNFEPSTDYEWHTKAWCTGNIDANGDSDPQYHSGWGDFSSFTT